MIEEKDKDFVAIDFFNEVLLPLALQERAKGKTFFPLGPHPEVESYYVEPTHSVMRASDFELRAAESIEDFITELAALWSSEGHAQLAGMAPKLTELAAEMVEQEDQQEEVSAFKYVMF